MFSEASQAQAISQFLAPLKEQLRNHPKRVVFTYGEDRRVIRVADKLAKEELVVPILLGKADRIKKMAAEEGADMTFIRVLEPGKTSDFELFCSRLEKIDRYRGVVGAPVEERVVKPEVYGSLMVQYGHADSLLGGNGIQPASLFRAFLTCIKRLPEVPKIFGATILCAPHLANFGENGTVFLADTGLLPIPSVEEAASIAIETGKLAHHLLGRTVQVAMLSHSTHGSASTKTSRRVAAATMLAKEKASELVLDMEIDGELQADVAMNPAAAEIKLGGAANRPVSDVLIFPNLDAAHISMKLLQHCAGAVKIGPLIGGLARPVAQVSLTASEATLYGTAITVAVEAIKYHELYPEGEV